ncbi:hypothetical protein [Streptomyces sp. MMBL 11-1]|uniref:hypothetical protein n=1 Tax=Streptomyces sp. MMBL 11-1 TaxID=3026420 RepID=UPI0023630AC1|nr:hypothetical protein [Streptomyces sp. MMBL 11-1]
MVDEVLAAALMAQGAAGVRALGLLRDARRVLAGTGLERRRRSRSRACAVRRTPC